MTPLRGETLAGMRPRKPKPSHTTSQNHQPTPSPKPDRATTHEIVRQTDALYAEAQDNPDSEAGQMVRAFVLSGIRNVQPRSSSDEAPTLALGEERRRQRQARHRLTGGAKAEAAPDRARRADRAQKTREYEAMLQEVAQTAATASAAAEAGRPLDAIAVYERIAEIVGLRSPLSQRVEPKLSGD
jgi:hypothetical protein